MSYRLNIEERTSKKTGKPYKALVITFPNGYQKLVFLDQAELFMFEQLLKEKE